MIFLCVNYGHNATVVIIEQKAVSNRNGQVGIEYSFASDPDATIAGSSMSYARGRAAHKITIETVSLDDYIRSKSIANVSLVKIDVEGAEMLVFEGMRGILIEMRPIIIVELAREERIREGKAFLEALDYTCSDVELKPSYTNVLAVPRESISDL